MTTDLNAHKPGLNHLVHHLAGFLEVNESHFRQLNTGGEQSGSAGAAWAGG